MRLVWGTVAAVQEVTAETQRLHVVQDDGIECHALLYLALTPAAEPGDRVLLNTTALDLGLGTGGLAFVVVRAGEVSGTALDRPSGGHIMKLRYTPVQLDVLAVESQESPHHALMRHAHDVGGMPVICCGLHSQVPLVAAAIKDADPSLTVAYCMTDGAALALGLSSVVRESVSAGLIDTTITCGQAFGGEYEAVNVHSGLLAARHVARADVAIVAIGPGVVGTATPFGHGGVHQGEAINACAALGGRPVACLRVSFADRRARHRGVSHHTIVALSRVALAPAHVAVPSLPDEYLEVVEEALERGHVWERHVRTDSPAGRVPPPSLRGVRVTTMGRGFAEDPAFFAAAFAAGEVAARLAAGAL